MPIPIVATARVRHLIKSEMGNLLKKGLLVYLDHRFDELLQALDSSKQRTQFTSKEAFGTDRGRSLLRLGYGLALAPSAALCIATLLLV